MEYLIGNSFDSTGIYVTKLYSEPQINDVILKQIGK